MYKHSTSRAHRRKRKKETKTEGDRQTYRQRVRLTIRLTHGKEERDRQTYGKKGRQCKTYHCRLSSRKTERENEREGEGWRRVLKWYNREIINITFINKTPFPIKLSLLHYHTMNYLDEGPDTLVFHSENGELILVFFRQYCRPPLITWSVSQEIILQG